MGREILVMILKIYLRDCFQIKFNFEIIKIINHLLSHIGIKVSWKNPVFAPSTPVFAMWGYTDSAYLLICCIFALYPFMCLNLFITCPFLSSYRLCPPLWKFQAVERCLRMWNTLPAVVHQRVASQTLSSTRKMAPRRPSKVFIPTQRWKLAAAPPQAHLRPSLLINQSCSAAWSISSSSSLDLSPCILPLGRLKRERSCSWGPWCQRTVSTVNTWGSVQNQGWPRESVLLLSQRPVSSS